MTVTAATTATPQTGVDVIDVDVHVSPSSVQDLTPWLSRYWVDYFADAETDLHPNTGGAYPPNAATTGHVAGSSVPGCPPDRFEVLEDEFLSAGRPGTAILSCVTSFAANRNPYQEAAITRAINEWTAAEFLDKDDRLRGSIVVPSTDIKAAVAEIDRAAQDQRFVQVLLPVRGHDARYGNVRFRDIFEAADRNGLAVGIHAWGRRGASPVPGGFTNTYIDDYLLNSQVLVQEQLVSIVAEGVFDQFPDLNVALLECGFTWLPALMMRFQKDWKAVWREVPWMKHEPMHYIYKNVRASTQPLQLPENPEYVRTILDQIRPQDLLMFASDFPHEHGGDVARFLDALTEDERTAVLHGNARTFYRRLEG